MICGPCRQAGALLEAGKPEALIAAEHARCRGGTWCDCRHVTTTALREDRQPDPRRGA
jgi:hypothetical protein